MFQYNQMLVAPLTVSANIAMCILISVDGAQRALQANCTRSHYHIFLTHPYMKDQSHYPTPNPVTHKSLQKDTTVCDIKSQSRRSANTTEEGYSSAVQFPAQMIHQEANYSFCLIPEFRYKWIQMLCLIMQPLKLKHLYICSTTKNGTYITDQLEITQCNKIHRLL